MEIKQPFGILLLHFGDKVGRTAYSNFVGENRQRKVLDEHTEIIPPRSHEYEKKYNNYQIHHILSKGIKIESRALYIFI
jgi:hypothetical protein